MSKVAVIGIVGNSVFLPVENFHVGGETIEAFDAKFEYGGKGFNQAVAASRFGAQVSFLGAVGSDGYEGIMAFFDSEGIKAHLIKKDTNTAFAAIITNQTGLNRVTVYQGAQLSENDVKDFEEEIKSADVLLINNEVSEQVNLVACEIAQKYGVKIILNPAPVRLIDKRILDKVYLFTPNEYEDKGLEGFDNVIQTLGAKGCLIKQKNIIVPPTKDKAIDTTGAGDTFNGVLAWAIASGMELYESVVYAVKASGKSVAKKGAVSSIPHKNEI